jgi:hypothetical protein
MVNADILETPSNKKRESRYSTTNSSPQAATFATKKLPRAYCK